MGENERPRGWRRFATPTALITIVAVCGLAFWIGTGDTPQGEPDASGPPWFEDATAGSGIHFTYRNGEEAGRLSILETLGGGVALLDYDNDGLLDIFLTGGGNLDGPADQPLQGYPCRLYRNLGNWKFQDVTKETGLERIWWYTHGVAVADYDRDGYPEFVVTGFGRVALFHNEAGENGKRRFVEVGEKLGLIDDSWSTSAGWGDINGDGFPDLYVCHYCDWSPRNNPDCAGQRPGVGRDVCPPERFKPLIHALFINEGGKRFRNVAAEQGFAAKGNGLGVMVVDVDDDRRPDIYVANDATNKFLFMNRGGRLEERGLAAGVAVDDQGKYNGSMGVDAADFDGSGRASLWVTNFQRELHALYRNIGGGRFQFDSKHVGLDKLDPDQVGFGTGFLDADNDGWEDLVMVHGHVLHFPPFDGPVKQSPVMLRNELRDGQREFRNISLSAGDFFRIPALGRGLAIGDLDNDGWPDVVVSHTNTPVVLLRNIVKRHGPANWIGLRLAGKGHRDIIGSTVIVESGGRSLTKFVKGGGSYLSAGDPRLLFGLGSNDTVPTITVKWSWGGTQTWENLKPGQYWELTEGSP